MLLGREDWERAMLERNLLSSRIAEEELDHEEAHLGSWCVLVKIRSETRKINPPHTLSIDAYPAMPDGTPHPLFCSLVQCGSWNPTKFHQTAFEARSPCVTVASDMGYSGILQNRIGEEPNVQCGRVRGNWGWNIYEHTIHSSGDRCLWKRGGRGGGAFPPGGVPHRHHFCEIQHHFVHCGGSHCPWEFAAEGFPTGCSSMVHDSCWKCKQCCNYRY